MQYAAELPGQQSYLYMGYVSSRKVFNFTLDCEPDRDAAASLFNKIMANFRVMIP